MVSAGGEPRPHYAALDEWLKSISSETVKAKRNEADLIFRRTGITFSLGGEDGGTERLIPSDLVPRIIDSAEWAFLERGLVQRVKAVNMFLHDVYHGQHILKSGLVPADQVLANAQLMPLMMGLNLQHQTYAHITGVDIIRHADGDFYVLEDNLRVPSGVSYMLSNRILMMRLFPDLFYRYAVRPVEHYPALLLQTLRSATLVEQPTIVLLTPGRFNSAYFEHAFLAKQMGIELVEGSDLFVRGDLVYMQTTEGPQRVDVIYRRIDDAYMDPLAFAPDSMIGVPGLAAVYRMGNVVIANALGTGVADDDLPLCPRNGAVLPGRGATAQKRADLAMPQTGGSQLRAGESGRSGGQGSPRCGRLRHAGRPGVYQGRNCRFRRARAGPA